MFPIDTPSMNGMGQTPSFMVEGTWVVGFFRDAMEKQQPVIIGTLPAYPQTTSNKELGFNDPNAKYPKSDFLDESDINRLAKGGADAERVTQVLQAKKINETKVFSQQLQIRHGMNQHLHMQASTHSIMCMRQNLGTIKSSMIQKAKREYQNTTKQEHSMKLMQVGTECYEWSDQTTKSFMGRILSMLKGLLTLQ